MTLITKVETVETTGELTITYRDELCGTEYLVVKLVPYSDRRVLVGIYKEVSEVRKLITIEQFLEDIKAEGLETDQVFIDPDDAVQIPEPED